MSSQTSANGPVTPTAAPASILPAIAWFALVFVLAVVVVQVAATMFQFELPGAMGLIFFVISLGPALNAFTKQNHRVMVGRERLLFALAAAIIAIVINVGTLLALTFYYMGDISFASISAAAGLDGLNAQIAAFVLGGSLLFAFIIAYVSAGFMGRSALKRQGIVR